MNPSCPKCCGPTDTEGNCMNNWCAKPTFDGTAVVSQNQLGSAMRTIEQFAAGDRSAEIAKLIEERNSLKAEYERNELKAKLEKAERAEAALTTLRSEKERLCNGIELLEAWSESERLMKLCQHVHDRLLRGESYKVLIAELETAWKHNKSTDCGKGWSKDDPSLDGTDLAHPAYWRGHEQTVDALCKKINEILDGKEVAGVSQEPWESTRKRITELNRLWQEHLKSENSRKDGETYGKGWVSPEEHAKAVDAADAKRIELLASKMGWVSPEQSNALDARIDSLIQEREKWHSEACRLMKELAATSDPTRELMREQITCLKNTLEKAQETLRECHAGMTGNVASTLGGVTAVINAARNGYNDYEYYRCLVCNGVGGHDEGCRGTSAYDELRQQFYDQGQKLALAVESFRVIANNSDQLAIRETAETAIAAINEKGEA